MKGKLGSNIVKKFKRSLNMGKKHVHLLYDLQLLSIFKDTIIITDENFIITYCNHFFEKIYSIKACEDLGEYLQIVLKTKYIGTKSPEIIKEFIRVGLYKTDFIQFTNKLFLFYINKLEEKLVEIWNKINLSNFETFNGNKLFLQRSD